MKHSKWVCHHPVFECEAYNPDLLIYAPWAGHRRFAYDYVRNVRPARIVELGSHYGCSAFTFLQAIKDGSANTEFFAVDTWQGDDFTRNDYTDDVYAAYKRINDALFGACASHMLRKRFDEALDDFTDGSIDLLHIDGSHNYDDIRRDYESWRPKVAQNGVVFFHDVSDDLFDGAPMGSHVFWEELKRQEPFTVEFPFSNGLGVLFLSGKDHEAFCCQVSVGYYQQLINYQDTINKDLIRRNSFTIRDLQFYNADLQKQVCILNHHLECYRTDTEKTAQYLQELEKRSAGAETAAAGLREENRSLGRQLYDANVQIRLLASDLDSLRRFVQEKEVYASDLEGQMDSLRAFAQEKEAYASDLEGQMDSLRAFAQEKEVYASDLEGQMDSLRAFVQEKEAYASNLESRMASLRSFAGEKEAYASDLEDQMDSLRIFAQQKESYTQELLEQIRQLNVFVGGKEQAIVALERDKAVLDTHVQEKNGYIAKLEGQLESLNEYAGAKCAYIEELELEKAAAAALRQENAQLHGRLATQREAHESLAAAYAGLNRQMQKLTDAIRRIPFGYRLLNAVLATTEEDK